MPKRTNAAVSLTLEEAKAIYHLYATCIASEKHFRNCQSASYRSFINGMAQAVTTKQAFEALQQRIREAETAEPAGVSARDAPAEETERETDKEGV